MACMQGETRRLGAAWAKAENGKAHMQGRNVWQAAISLYTNPAHGCLMPCHARAASLWRAEILQARCSIRRGAGKDECRPHLTCDRKGVEQADVIVAGLGVRPEDVRKRLRQKTE
eukprot:353830-Chlamydomonas_euryale.AAC.18